MQPPDSFVREGLTNKASTFAIKACPSACTITSITHPHKDKFQEAGRSVEVWHELPQDYSTSTL